MTINALETNSSANAPKPMLNPISAYEEAGRKAGTASRRKDIGTVEFESRWMRRAIALEAEENRVAARKAFDDAYRAEATPTPLLF